MFSKKYFFMALCLVSIVMIGIFAVPVNANTTKAKQIAHPKIAFVFSTGGLGDLSFNDAGMVGLVKSNATHGLNVTEADWAEPKDVPEITDLVEAFAATEEYDLILTIGFSSADAVNQSALAHPNQKYAIIDMVIDLPNVASIVYNEHEGSFLCGVMAAMTTTSDKIGFLGGEEISLIKKFEAGYIQGAKSINPDIEVFSQYAPNQADPWNDISGGKTVGLDFIEDGADIIYAAAGGTGKGMFNAVNETNTAAEITGTDSKTDKPEKVYAIGVDQDQDWTHKGYILTSMVKRVDLAVEGQINATVDGTWVGGAANLIILGLSNDGVGISNMMYTEYEKDVIWNGTSTRMDIVKEYSDLIVAGDIVVDTEPEEADTAPGFGGFLAILGLFSIAIIPLMRRKFKN
ncbi:MAG: BMP family lipoprotein [Candidatus Hodarchaeales archaeon]